MSTSKPGELTGGARVVNSSSNNSSTGSSSSSSSGSNSSTGRAANPKGGSENNKKGSEDNPHETSRAARREVMREQKIPTSQQPNSQSKNDSGNEYTYGNKSVQQQTKDRSHEGKSHWEAGTIKQRDGKVLENNDGRANLENVPKKSKSHYDEH